MVHLGIYLSVFLIPLLESIGVLFVPSEATMVFGGIMAAEHKASLPLVILAGVLGATIGAALAYGVAYSLESRIEPLLGRIGIKPMAIEKLRLLTKRYGLPFVFVGRLIPFVRAVISYPVGLSRMRLNLFLIATALGATALISADALGGYYLGGRIHQILGLWQHHMVLVGLGIVLLLAVIWVVHRAIHRAFNH